MTVIFNKGSDDGTSNGSWSYYFIGVTIYAIS